MSKKIEFNASQIVNVALAVTLGLGVYHLIDKLLIPMIAPKLTSVSMPAAVSMPVAEAQTV